MRFLPRSISYSTAYICEALGDGMIRAPDLLDRLVQRWPLDAARRRRCAQHQPGERRRCRRDDRCLAPSSAQVSKPSAALGLALQQDQPLLLPHREQREERLRWLSEPAHSLACRVVVRAHVQRAGFVAHAQQFIFAGLDDGRSVPTGAEVDHQRMKVSPQKEVLGVAVAFGKRLGADDLSWHSRTHFGGTSPPCRNATPRCMDSGLAAHQLHAASVRGKSPASMESRTSDGNQEPATGETHTGIL